MSDEHEQPEMGVVHEIHSGEGLLPGEVLRWQHLDETRDEYRLDCPDGAGAAMEVSAGTPQSQVVEWLHADVEMARRGGP